ncbi:hypothetical protein GCM10010353_38480 [Streptomyces chryseus]|uniref:Uncharacterized protein n=1 Tax=Streptomyces chryseus TaxID=68186 RepID=A0ABQ3DY16_9ACTN|nr:hypothetical protein GCM10010353_38480 [Streptomyces chryseus]GHB17410.1 hypothetical protein GCM10010346_46620 [Streptomyces chryseus]
MQNIRDEHRRRTICNPQLLDYPGHMGLGRPFGDAEPTGQQPVRLTTAEQPQHFPFTLGQ